MSNDRYIKVLGQQYDGLHPKRPLREKRGFFVCEFCYDKHLPVAILQLPDGERFLLRTVMKTIREHELFSCGDTVVVAVSGGADSVALLDILAGLGELRLRLVIAHVNHLLRGAESDGDEAFVKDLAGHYGLPVESRAVDVRELSRRRRLSLEEAGRIARYAVFAEVAGAYRAKCTAIAHHADDQAETVLMRLVRGSGASGLCAMAPKSADGSRVRPLLQVGRREIEAYLAARGLVFRSDSSNSNVNFLRNRIRHELIPCLASYNPAISARLADTAAAIRADEALLEHVTDEAMSRLASVAAGRVTFPVVELATEPRGMRMRLLRRALLMVRGDLARIGFRHLQAIDELLIPGRPQRRLSLPGDLAVMRSYDTLVVEATDGGSPAAPFEIFLEGPGTYPLPGGTTLTIEEAAQPPDWSAVSADTGWFDAENAPFPWLLRTFRPGDRIVPFGMTGSKKVKELFIDARIPLCERRRIPLVFSGGRLIWVCGVRVAEGARVAAGTPKIIRAAVVGGALN